MNIDIKYGISLVSILQLGRNIQESMADAIKIGYNGFQSLPMKNGITGLEENIFCYEDAWRPELEHFWQVKKERLFDDLLALFLLFKKGKARRKIINNYNRNNITSISHVFNGSEVKNNTLYEINPELGSISNIKHICGNKKVLVADIKHLIDYEKLDKNTSLEDLIGSLRENLAPIIHFQPICDIDEFIEKTKFLDHEDKNSNHYELREIQILKYLLDIFKANFSEGLYEDNALKIILEYNPKWRFLNKNKSAQLAGVMLQRVKSLI